MTFTELFKTGKPLIACGRVIDEGGLNKVKILLTTDGSEFSEGAAKFLKCFNLASEYAITICHALCRYPVDSCGFHCHCVHPS